MVYRLLYSCVLCPYDDQVALGHSGPPELLLDEILNLKKKLMEKETMLQHLDQVRIVRMKCK